MGRHSADVHRRRTQSEHTAANHRGEELGREETHGGHAAEETHSAQDGHPVLRHTHGVGLRGGNHSHNDREDAATDKIDKEGIFRTEPNQQANGHISVKLGSFFHLFL